MSRENFNTVLSLFQSSSALRCNEVMKALRSLGFEVRDGSNGGHKIFVHGQLKGFISSSFNCDHGKNPQIKAIYIKKIRKILEEYSEELSKMG